MKPKQKTNLSNEDEWSLEILADWGVKLRYKEVKVRQSISSQLKYCTAVCCNET